MLSLPKLKVGWTVICEQYPHEEAVWWLARAKLAASSRHAGLMSARKRPDGGVWLSSVLHGTVRSPRWDADNVVSCVRQDCRRH